MNAQAMLLWLVDLSVRVSIPLLVAWFAIFLMRRQSAARCSSSATTA